MAHDMWSLGCILAELSTGYPTFPGENDQEQLAYIMEILGSPDKETIARSSRKQLFFGLSYTRISYPRSIAQIPVLSDRVGNPHSVVNSRGRRLRVGTKTLASVLRSEREDYIFVDFIAKCFHWDPERRLKPENALQHPFITAGHCQVLPVTSMAANSSLSSRVEAATLGTPNRTQISAPIPFAARTVGNRPAPRPPVPSIQDMPTGNMVMQSPHYQTSHHTDVMPGNPLEIDSSHSKGDNPVEAEDDEVAYMTSPYLRQLVGSAGCSVWGKEAAELGSKLHLVCYHLKPDIMWLMLISVPSI